MPWAKDKASVHQGWGIPVAAKVMFILKCLLSLPFTEPQEPTHLHHVTRDNHCK